MCVRTFNGTDVDISCTKNPSHEEEIKLNALRIESKVWGFGCLLVLVVLWMICANIPCLNRQFYQLKYEKYVRTETHTCTKKKLQEKAEEQAGNISGEALERIFSNEVNDEEAWIEISEPTFHLKCLNSR